MYAVRSPSASVSLAESKVGYSLARKVVLMGLWAASPLVLLADPSFLGLVAARDGVIGFLQNLGMIWLALGVAGQLFRTIRLFFVRDVETGLVWPTKIVTDPFSVSALDRRAPDELARLGAGGIKRARA